MATKVVENINLDMLKWAFNRAGYTEEKAIDAFPSLSAWLSGEKKPTMNQLQRFAAKFYVPFGYLFLNHAPLENLPFPMFRGTAGQDNHFDLNVYDTVMTVQGRQEWLEEYLTENGIELSPLVGIITKETPVAETVCRLREILDLEPRWAFSLRDVDVAVSRLTERLEEAGVFVSYNGVVGNNTHRPLKVSECRGFALASRVAPYIFVNSSDSKSAQMFTLIHEATHLMLGESVGYAGDETVHVQNDETYCDMVAAEFLVPRTELCGLWNGNIKALARMFKVSEIVVARRAYKLNLLSVDEYRSFWQEYSNRPIVPKKHSSGGSFYLTSVKRIGRLFAVHVHNAVNSRQLNYTDAYRLTGLSGRTYQHFMTNNI